MGGLIGSLVTKGMEDEVTPDMIVGMVTAITSQVSEDEFIPLTENILSTTEIFADDGKRRKIIFDIDFMGLYGHLVKLLVAVLNFQYANFFDVLAERGEARQEQGGRPSPNKIKARG